MTVPRSPDKPGRSSPDGTGPLGAASVLADPAARDLLQRIIRARSDGAALSSSLSTDGVDADAVVTRLLAEGFLVEREGVPTPRPPSVAISEASIATLRRHRDEVATLLALMEHLPALDRVWEEGTQSAWRGIEGEVITGAMQATSHWVSLLSRQAPVDPGSTFPSFASMRSFLTPMIDLFANIGAGGGNGAAPPFRFLVNSLELADDRYRAMLDALIAGGASVRVVPVVPLFLYVDRGIVAGIPFVHDDGAAPAGGVFFYNGPTVDAFAALFERWWADATVYPISGDGWRPVLQLMAQGHSDKQIATILGLGLRTVRRRIAEAAEHLGAPSRFELGVAWARAAGGEG